MSTRAQMRAAVLYRLGNRTDVTNDQLDKWLNDGLADLTTRRVQLRSLETTGSPILTQVGVAGYSIGLGTTLFSLDYMEDTSNKRVLYRMKGGFPEYLIAKQGGATGPPTRFVERGSTVLLHPTPDTQNWVIIPYGYRYASWGPDPGDSPLIEPEWHYGVELVANEHGARDLEMPEKATQIAQEFEAWLALRDTSTRRTNRFDLPQRGVSPATASRRNLKTGV